ncbi:MAG: hypothetical protein WA941_15490 [Nitrososphaeraceae archaeon]
MKEILLKFGLKVEGIALIPVLNKQLQIDGMYLWIILRKKISSQLDFSDEELHIIDEITITLALVFEEIVESVSSKGLLQ